MHNNLSKINIREVVVEVMIKSIINWHHIININLCRHSHTIIRSKTHLCFLTMKKWLMNMLEYLHLKIKLAASMKKSFLFKHMEFQLQIDLNLQPIIVSTLVIKHLHRTCRHPKIRKDINNPHQGYPLKTSVTVHLIITM